MFFQLFLTKAEHLQLQQTVSGSVSDTHCSKTRKVFFLEFALGIFMPARKIRRSLKQHANPSVKGAELAD